ncbi:AAA family ATPase [Brucella pseudogrignonensis]|uniref:SpoVK/Ycf46/Vps4 family AAA+-type ATPase n=1 Tax=Brucella pseudogrignonensis TaxID=419475 RepID=A0ABU1MF07_9HYPH|nr:AAA family ATPase [Brucella pseudogrignonensis]MDR6434612.1 SpoVK/Ycf46/Vps4 family AAA+-type ATPase [Brucella pseudogrignonensis]
MAKATVKIFVGPHGTGKTEAAKQLAAELGIDCIVTDMTYRPSFDYSALGIPEINPYFAASAVAVLEDFDGASANAKREVLNYAGIVESDTEFPPHIYILTTQVHGKRIADLPGSIVGGSPESLRGVIEGLLEKSGFDRKLLKAADEIRIFGAGGVE